MDENRAAEFTGRVLADSAAAATIVLAALGDRTGLFKDMAEHGPATSGELADRAHGTVRAGMARRHVRCRVPHLRRRPAALPCLPNTCRLWPPNPDPPSSAASTRS